MNRSTLLTLGSLSSLGLVATLAACDLNLGTKDAAKDMGAASGAPPADGGADASAPDAAADGAADKAPDTDGGADGDAGSASNATTPPAPTVPLWTPAPPDGDRVTLNAAGDDKCSFEMAYIVENTDPQAPPQYTITLEKKDDQPGTCAEAKGFIVLTQHSYGLPAGVVRRHSTDPLIAIAWNEKATPADAAPVVLRLQQIDWTTGADLHDGVMSVKGAPAGEAPSLVPTSMNLSVGYDVIMSGTGAFPGATGQGLGFEARWGGFLSTKPQPAAAADEAALQ